MSRLWQKRPYDGGLIRENIQAESKQKIRQSIQTFCTVIRNCNSKIILLSLVQFIEESPRNQGIWVVYKCNGKCNLLLDTCATNSIPSDRLHAEIIKPVKMNFTQRIVKAELDTQKLCCKVGEAIAIVDRSLGLDFLESYKCLIDGF